MKKMFLKINLSRCQMEFLPQIVHDIPVGRWYSRQNRPPPHRLRYRTLLHML
jgi:hypothetical protein